MKSVKAHQKSEVWDPGPERGTQCGTWVGETQNTQVSATYSSLNWDWSIVLNIK